MTPRAALLLFAGCASLAGAGCGGASDAPPAVAAQPALPAVVDSPKPEAQPVPQPTRPQPPVAQPVPKPVEPPPARNDLGELAVRKALMPSVTPAPASLAPTAPRPRLSSDLDRGELPLPKVSGLLPPSPLPKAKPALPGAPAERPPLALGNAAALGVGAFPVPDRPLLKAARPANPAAPDTPALARQLSDRASVEDPTADLSAKGVVSTPLPLPSFALPYLKSVIPDPFEFAEQLKGKLGKETEFGTVPVVVPPEKR